jgi:CheY-like chemotaxis protein
MSITTPSDPQRVLFVDDEPRVLRGLIRLLRSDRWQLDTAESGAAALEMLDGGSYDAVVSDYRMPGMDGVTLLQHVRDAHPGIVRIVLTGDIDLGPALRSTAVAHKCLTKPCQPELITAALERGAPAARHARPRRPAPADRPARQPAELTFTVERAAAAAGGSRFVGGRHRAGHQR